MGGRAHDIPLSLTRVRPGGESLPLDLLQVRVQLLVSRMTASRDLFVGCWPHGSKKSGGSPLDQWLA